MKKPTGPPRMFGAEQIQAIIAAYLAGATLRELGEQYGCEATTIRQYLLRTNTLRHGFGYRKPRKI